MHLGATARSARRNALVKTALPTLTLFFASGFSVAQTTTSAQNLLSRVPAENRQAPLTTARPLDPQIQDSSKIAFPLILKAANFGNPAAQTEIGYRYAFGLGVARDDTQAFRWFQRAAAEHYAPAQYDLGFLLMSGRGVAQDMPQAVRWFERAAAQGMAEADVSLAFAYNLGLGVTPDPRKAFDCARRAAKRHYAQGEFMLGAMYELGRGVEPNFSEAAKWYEKAAKQGYAAAENNLAGLYHHGLGVTTNVQEAIKLYKLAAEQGDETSYANLARLYADNSTGRPDYYVAYFWAMLGTRCPSPDYGPPPEQFIHELSGRLSSDQVTRVKAEVEDWIRTHPGQAGWNQDAPDSKTRSEGQLGR